MHSQSVSEKPAQPWIILKKDGTIVAANCDCKAGLGSACTHAAACIFYLECATRIREKATVTGEKAYWLLPSGLENSQIEAKPVSEIDFTSAKNRQKKLDAQVEKIGESSDR